MASLFDPVTILPGIGPTRAQQLAKLNIRTLYDLIAYFPRGYEDRTRLRAIADWKWISPPASRPLSSPTPAQPTSARVSI